MGIKQKNQATNKQIYKAKMRAAIYSCLLVAVAMAQRRCTDENDPMATRIFEKSDTDGDKFLSGAELQKARRQTNKFIRKSGGENITSAEWDDLVAIHDSDSDGK